MLNLNIKISKFSNLYSFVSDLSQWGDYKYFEYRKKEWIRKTGKLSKKENNLLLRFKNIQEKSNEHIELFFIFEKESEIKKKLKHVLSREDLGCIFYILSCFENRFNVIWENIEKKLLWTKERIEKKNIDPVIVDIFSLCDINKKDRLKVDINLLISGFSDLHGWVSGSDIAMECSGWRKKDINELINTIMPHEFFHILISKNKKIKKEISMMVTKEKERINNVNKNFGLSNQMFLEELVLSSFIPEGYLLEKYSKININKNYKDNINSKDKLRVLRLYIADKMRDVAKEYVEDNKVIDKNYIEKIIK